MIRRKVGSAITLINAIAWGVGATFGIRANIEVTIEKCDGKLIEINPEGNSPDLVNACIRQIERNYIHNVDNIKITTQSDLPSQRGMKTSSGIAAATIAALSDFYDLKLNREVIIEQSALASIKSKASITGAVDDAYSAYSGGGHLTRNGKFYMLKEFEVPVGFEVFLLIPDEKLPKQEIGNLREQISNKVMYEARRELEKGNWERTIEINTSQYAPLLLKTPEIINELRIATESIVGLNGAGPSLFVITEVSRSNEIQHVIEDSFTKYLVYPTSFRKLEEPL